MYFNYILDLRYLAAFSMNQQKPNLHKRWP